MIFRGQALRMYFTTGIDDTNTTEVLLKYRKRDGTQGERSDASVEDEATGKYYVDWENEELDELKTWTFWSYVTTLDGNEFPGNPWQDDIKAEGDSPVSREQIKEFLGITVDTNDAFIDALIPLLVEQYETIRNAPFPKVTDSVTGDTVHIYPSGMPVTIALMMDVQLNMRENSEYRTASSEKIGSYSINYGSGDANSSYGYPASIVSQIKRYIRAL